VRGTVFRAEKTRCGFHVHHFKVTSQFHDATSREGNVTVSFSSIFQTSLTDYYLPRSDVDIA